MSTFSLRATALLLAWWPACAVIAAPLDLTQAIDLAVQRSQMTASARAGVRGAAEMARAAGQLPDPMLTVGLDNLPVTGADRFRTAAEDMTMKRIGLSQEWVPADKRAARQAVAEAAHRRESVLERVAAADTRMQTAMAFVDAYFTGEALQLSALTERHAREALEAGKARLATTAGSAPEVLGLGSALGSAEDESADGKQQRSAAWVQLQRWTGLGAPSELAPPRFEALPTQADYVARHPQVITREREIEVARREAEVTRLDRHPNWTVEVSYGQRAGGRSDLVSIGLNIPLPVSPSTRQDRETAARLAMVDKAEAEAEEARRAAGGEYAAWTSDSQRLQERIARLRTGVLTPLAQRTAATLAAYRANQASLSMLFEARQAEVEAQRKLLNLQRDLARVQAQLVYKPTIEGGAR